MKKFFKFCFAGLLCLSLISCNSFAVKKNKTPALKQGETVPSSENKIISNKSDIRLNPYIKQKITYTKETIALWINQFIFIKGGDASGKAVSEFDGDKSKVILKYYKNDKINKIDLTSFLLKYNLYQGVRNINISPNNKYIALEFGSNECNKTLLVDTDENKAKMLWYSEKDDNSMQKVIWNGNNDYKFYFFPSAGLGELYTYNIKDNSKKEIYKISSKYFVPENSIITFNNDNIIVIDTENLKTYKVNIPYSLEPLDANKVKEENFYKLSYISLYFVRAQTTGDINKLNTLLSDNLKVIQKGNLNYIVTDNTEWLLYDESFGKYKDMLIQGYKYDSKNDMYKVNIREFYTDSNGELKTPPRYIDLYFKQINDEWKIVDLAFDV